MIFRQCGHEFIYFKEYPNTGFTDGFELSSKMKIKQKENTDLWDAAAE
jgi:hypothetical protein